MNSVIKPTSDIFVLYLLGSEKNKDLLMSFVNAVLKDKDLPLVKELTLKNPFNLKSFHSDKESILDIKAIDENSHQFDIEIQATYDPSFAVRSLYYWAKFYSSQLKESVPYEDLKPTICINLLDFNLLPDKNQIHSCFLLTEKNNPELVLTDHIMIHFIEIKKFKEQFKVMNPELYDWIYYFKYATEEDKMKLVIDNNKKFIQKALKVLKEFNEDDHLRDLALSRHMYQMDKISQIKNAEKRGEKRGEKKGKIEGKIETAKTMLKLKADLDFIHQVTGLSIEEIEKLTPESL